MRISAPLLGFFCLLAASEAQAQDPGAQQDAEAAREKLLKASDQLDNIQANSESTRTAVDGMKADLAKLQTDLAQTQADNTALKQQVAALQAAFDKSEAARARERQVLLDEVAKLVASGKGKSSAKKKEAPAAAENATPAPQLKTSDAGTDTGGGTPGSATSATDSTGPGDTGTAPVTVPKGYYHMVESGETLRLICSAYRQKGVNVTVSEIQKANGLTDKSVLKVGQKLFIPKPGTQGNL